MQEATANSSCPAKSFATHDRQLLALQSLEKEQSITSLAKKHNVSRKFLHQQKNKALSAINNDFKARPSESDVLFTVKITKSWITQLILCLALHGRSSFRGIIKILKDMFHYNISVGGICNKLKNFARKAKTINSKQDLTHVTAGAHDELFHNNRPVLAGVDIKSLYCYLLSQEEQRDGETWAIHLLDLQEQGFNPDCVITDNGEGLIAGHKLACPHIPRWGDVFHIIKSLKELRQFVRNRHKTSITYYLKIDGQMDDAKLKKKGQDLSRKWALAKADEEKMWLLSTSIETLVHWMQHDILCLAGPDYQTRSDCYNFIVDELENIKSLCEHRIAPIITALNNQKTVLLSFVEAMHEKFSTIAKQLNVDIAQVWEMCELLRCQPGGDNYAVRSVALQLQVSDDTFYQLEDLVCAVLSKTERASSMVENLNSRLRPYFSLRQEIGHDYLELLRFYLNHTPLISSEVKARKNKTPSELLAGKPHQHWLEMLGFPSSCKLQAV